MPSKVNTARIILKVLGWIQIVVAVIFLLMFIIGSVFIGTSGQEGAAAGSAIMGGLGLIFAIVFVVIGIVYLLTAKGIADKKNWAKIVGIILGILSLPSIPIGTVLGIFILIGLIGEEADSWFTA
jgi:p-aminobenzoyl-glutamate transporter AbgT